MVHLTGHQKHLNMKKKLLAKISLILIPFASVLVSCEDDERLTAQDTQDITEEAITDAYFQDMDDMSSVAVSSPEDDEFSGGRVATTFTINDDRFQCDGIVVTLEPAEDSNLDIPKGTITIDFGTGCQDLRGNTRSGKLIVTYEGWRFMPGSKVITTTNNYVINGIKLEGTRTLTNVTASNVESPTFEVVLEDGKATWEDGSFALRESTIVWSWIRAANPLQDELHIAAGSEASGTNRNGRAYTVEVTKELEYQRLCRLATTGTKKYVIDGDKEIVIDYGDGTCDNSVVVTVNGVTRNLSI